MAGQLTPAVAELAEKIFSHAVASEIAGAQTNQSYEEIADQAFKAAIAFSEVGRNLSRR